MQHAARPNRQQNRKALDRGIADIKTRHHEWRGNDCLGRQWGCGTFGAFVFTQIDNRTAGGLFDFFLPKCPRGFCRLYFRLVCMLHVGDLGLLGALDHRQCALDRIEAWCLSTATETNNGRPESAWLRP